MNDLSPHNPDFSANSSSGQNMLWQYVQSLDSQTASRLSQPSSEAVQVMERNILGMLGGLPQEHFDVTITTNREQLGRLLASAMIGGYFLHNAEQRLEFEQQFSGISDKDVD